MVATGKIIIFDGYCNFCSGAVLFIIKRDRRKRFLYAASQGSGGKKIMEAHGLEELASRSVILVERGGVYQRSEAAIRIARGLPGLWPVFCIFMAIPRRWRDYLYDQIAARRHRLFGLRDECFIPTPEIRDRFIDPQLPPVP